MRIFLTTILLGVLSVRSGFAQNSSESLLNIVPTMCPARSITVRAADRFLQELESAGKSDDKFFQYYRAVALKAKREPRQALEAAQGAVRAAFAPTHFEAQSLVLDLQRQLNPVDQTLSIPERIARGRQRREDEWEVRISQYPYGQTEFHRIDITYAPDDHIARPFKVNFGDGSALAAARLYARLKMYDSALRMYNRAAGFLDEDQRFDAFVAIDIWKEVAMCHSAKGEWEIAQGYFLKALVTIGRVSPKNAAVYKELSDAAIANRRVEVPLPEPKREDLEEIVRLCVKCRLFADAFETVAEIEKMGEHTSLETQIILHEGIVKMIEEMKEGYIAGVKFRGIDVNEETLSSPLNNTTFSKAPSQVDFGGSRTFRSAPTSRVTFPATEETANQAAEP